MPVARRPLLTAAAAGTLLCALWFVPSANATAEGAAVQAAQKQSGGSASGHPAEAVQDTREAQDTQGSEDSEGSPDAQGSEDSPGAQEAQGGTPQQLSLADTGSVDTTPYLIGGTMFLAVGAGFVSFAVRRSGVHPA
ncbi:hypothetical protein [Streptomyces sp. NPDC055709]